MGCACCEGSCGKDVRVSFCPKCKSRSVGYVFGIGNLFGVIPKMKCRDCGFVSLTFPVLITNEVELKKVIGSLKTKNKKVVRKKKVATHNGVFPKLATKVAFSSGKKKVVKKK